MEAYLEVGTHFSTSSLVKASGTIQNPFWESSRLISAISIILGVSYIPKLNTILNFCLYNLYGKKKI